jgi:hypothetical protein
LGVKGEDLWGFSLWNKVHCTLFLAFEGGSTMVGYEGWETGITKLWKREEYILEYK